MLHCTQGHPARGDEASTLHRCDLWVSAAFPDTGPPAEPVLMRGLQAAGTSQIAVRLYGLRCLCSAIPQHSKRTDYHLPASLCSASHSAPMPPILSICLGLEF